MNYKRLLQNQYEELIEIEDVIIRKATNLYRLVTEVPETEMSTAYILIKRRCLDFKFLEEKCKEYL